MKNTRGRSRNIRSRRRRILISKIIICVVVCIGVIFGIKTAANTFFQKAAKIVLKADDAEMREAQTIPEIKVNVTVQGEKDIVLDKKTGYTVQKLIDDLKNGENYTVTNETDGKTEGSFPVKIVLKEGESFD